MLSVILGVILKHNSSHNNNPPPRILLVHYYEKKMMHFSCFAQHNFPLIFLFHNFLRPKKRCFHYLLCLLDWVLHPAQILGPTTYCCYNEPYFHVGYITKIESVASHNTTNCALPAQRSTFFKNNVIQIHRFGIGGISHGCSF